MSTHTSIGTMQYATGDWYVVAKENGFVLLPGHMTASTLERVWLALDSGRIAAVIDAMTATAGAPLSAVPPFAIAIGHGPDLRVAVRGDVRVVYDDGARQELITGGRMETWVEQELPVHVALLVTPPESQIDETLLPLISGIARAGLVAVGTQEHPVASTVAAAPVGSLADAAAIDAPALADVDDDGATGDVTTNDSATDDHTSHAGGANDRAGTDGDAGSDSAPADLATDDSAAADGAANDGAANDGVANDGVANDDAANSGATNDSAAADTDTDNNAAAGNNGDAYGHAVADEDIAAHGAAAVSPDGTAPTGEPTAEAGGTDASAPESPAGQHDMALDGITGDHDGHTVKQTFLEAARAAGLVSDTDPDAASAAAVGFDDAPDFFAEFGIDLDGTHTTDESAESGSRALQGRVVLSTGVVLDLDRTLIVGRRPRIEQGMSDDIPELITVASPTHDISRNHVEIRRDGEAVTVTDLNTTNGTMLLREGDGPLRLHPGEATMVLSGDVLDIGDDVTLRFEDIP